MHEARLAVELLVGLEMRRHFGQRLVGASDPFDTHIQAHAIDQRVKPREVDPVLERNVKRVLLDRPMLVGIGAQAFEQVVHDLAVRDFLAQDLGLDRHRAAVGREAHPGAGNVGKDLPVFGIAVVLEMLVEQQLDEHFSKLRGHRRVAALEGLSGCNRLRFHRPLLAKFDNTIRIVC